MEVLACNARNGMHVRVCEGGVRGRRGYAGCGGHAMAVVERVAADAVPASRVGEALAEGVLLLVLIVLFSLNRPRLHTRYAS
jgi:hypothetical protein